MKKDDSMKIFVTGGSGYLGRRVCRVAGQSGATVWGGFGSVSAEVPSVAEAVAFDLRDTAACIRIVHELRPDAIVHCAAVNPGKNPDLMQPINVEGTRAVARAAREIDARLVHVSTDVVHDGSAAPYADDAPPSPLGLYAETKADGEKAVCEEAAERAAIVRTSLIYDLDEIDNGTASFLDRLEENPPLGLFNDVLRQPVFAPALAEALLRLAQSDFTGFLNVAGEETLTREEFGRRMLAHWGCDPEDPRIQSVSAKDLGITVARDLRLDLELSRSLGISSPGPSEVLG